MPREKPEEKEDGVPLLCKKCEKIAFSMIAPQPFICLGCFKKILPIFQAAWKYCTSCTIDKNRCGLCGAELTK